MSTVQVVYPNADLAGAWELTEPLPVDGTGYTEPLLVGVDSASYVTADSAADAAQVGALTLPTVLLDDVAVLVAAVSDETVTAELAVVPTIQGTDEVQTIASWLKSGTFTITYDGQTTSALNWDDDAATIETALEALSNIASGEATVAGGPLDGLGAAVTVTFSGALAATDLTLMTVSVAYVAPVNEVQTLTSDRTGGTFTLTQDGNTTTAIAYNATAATIRTALNALAHLDSGDVTLTGGGLSTNPVVITFTGAQAGTDVTAITVTDSGTGGTAITMTQTTAGVAETGLTVTETAPGVAIRSFVLETSFNIPQVGDTGEPQIHVWKLPLVAADSGKSIDFSVADHGTLHTWAASVQVWRGLDTTDPLEDVGTESNGDAAVATWGSVTPTTAGSKVLAIIAKAKAVGYVTTASSPSVPSGYTTPFEVVSDAMTLTGFLSGAVSAAAETPEPVYWSTARDYATGLVTLQPATASAGGADLYAVVDSEDLGTWVEIGTAAGSMYEVLELDLTSIPSGAILLGAKVEFAHSCSVKNKVRAVLVGISAGDVISPGVEQQLGYLPTPINQVQEQQTGLWYELADGSAVSDYSRLGIALFSSSRHPQLSSHKVYWARAEVEYETGGPVVSAVAGPVTAGDPVSWTYASASGFSQTHYQVMVVAGSAQDPDLATVAGSVLDAATGEIVYNSGRLAGDLVRALTLATAPLGRGTHTVGVRSWARLESGVYVASAWDTADFDITGAPATTPAQATTPVFDTSSGGVDVDVAVPAGVSRAWLARSVDAGVTWSLVEDAPFAVTASTTETLTDYNAPLQAATLRYQVSFDTGSMAETSAPGDVGVVGDISTPAGAWYFIVPDDTTLNTQISVKANSVQRPVRTQTAEQPGNSVTASSLPLATRISLQLWIKDNAERLAVTAVLESGLTIRLVNIWGQEWNCRNVTGVSDDPQRWKALPAETTGLRDAHVYTVDLLEEVSPA